MDQWQHIQSRNGGEPFNLLEAFYKDPSRFAYTFQNYVFVTRFMQVCDMPGILLKGAPLECCFKQAGPVPLLAPNAKTRHSVQVYPAQLGHWLVSILKFLAVVDGL